MDENLLRFKNDITYALIDLETFNLNLSFAFNRCWQVGVLVAKNDKIVDARDIRINWPDVPHLKIGKEAALITHFNQAEHDKLAVNPDVAFKRFWPILQNADYIIMHNGLKFDLYLLKDYAKMMGQDWKWMLDKVIDTRAVAQGIKLGIPFKPKDEKFIEYQYRVTHIMAKGIKTSLTALGKEFGIVVDYNALHDAINDLTLNWHVWNKLKYQIDI